MIYPTDEGNISIYSVNSTDNIEINGNFHFYAFYTNLPSNGVYSSDYQRYTDRSISVPSGSNWIAIAHAKSDNPTINKPSLGGIYNELDGVTSDLKNKFSVQSFTVKTGAGSNYAGLATINKSDYPDILAIVPLGFDVSSLYNVGSYKEDDMSFSFLINESTNNNEWASDKTITFITLVIKK